MTMKTNITGLGIIKQELFLEVVEARNLLNRIFIGMGKKRECILDVLQGNIPEAHHTGITVEQDRHHQVGELHHMSLDVEDIEGTVLLRLLGILAGLQK